MQTRLDPVRMTELADDWQRAVDRIGDVLVDLDHRLAAQLDRSWRGRGADASTSALRRYVAGSLEGLPACRSVAVHLGELACAASDLRATFSQSADDALAHVRQLYSAPAVAAGNAVADIPAPPEPLPSAGSQHGDTQPAGLSQAAVPQGVAQLPTAPNNPAVPAGAASDPSIPDSSPLSAPRAPQPWHAPTYSSALPPPLDDTAPARPGMSPSPSTTTGPPAGAAPPAAGTPRATSAPPQSFGAPFMGGMYPGHLGRDGGGEHRTPKYLISAGNSNELIGDLPLVAPPVIGE